LQHQPSLGSKAEKTGKNREAACKPFLSHMPANRSNHGQKTGQGKRKNDGQQQWKDSKEETLDERLPGGEYLNNTKHESTENTT